MTGGSSPWESFLPIDRIYDDGSGEIADRSLRKTIERLHELEEPLTPGPAPSVAPAVLERIQRLDRE